MTQPTSPAPAKPHIHPEGAARRSFSPVAAAPLSSSKAASMHAAAAMPSRCWSRLQSPHSSRANTQLTPRLLSVLFLFGMPLLWLLPFHGGKIAAFLDLHRFYLFGCAGGAKLPTSCTLSPSPRRIRPAQSTTGEQHNSDVDGFRFSDAGSFS
jgi:hypothetical protein